MTIYEFTTVLLNVVALGLFLSGATKQNPSTARSFVAFIIGWDLPALFFILMNRIGS